MTWDLTDISSIWLAIFTFILLIMLSVYGWLRRREHGALAFATGSLLSVFLVILSVLQHLAANVNTKFLWFEIQVLFQLAVVSAITCFILDYAWPGRWLTRRNLLLFSIPLLLLAGLTVTNSLHHWLWLGFTYDGSAVTPVQTPLSWFFLVYGNVLGIVNLIVFSWLFLRSPQHRWPVVIMALGQIGSRSFFFLQLSKVAPTSLSLDVFPLVFAYLMYAIALFGFHIFDPIPLARRTAIEQLRAGMLVLDPQGKIVSKNQAAERILGIPGNRAKNNYIQEVLPSYPDRTFSETEGAEMEFSLGEGQALRCYSLAVSILKDWRGLEIGRLLLLRDLTDQKMIQTRILEQQRALAMLHERERMARELHDSLGQVFAFVNAQGQTVRRLLGKGEIATADEYVSRMVDVAQQADVDIRESILGLRVTLTEQGFIPALEKYLAQYEKNYGITTEFILPDSFSMDAFEPLVEVQLLRILQEALTNVRKHSSADRVRIVLAVENGLGRVSVQDNGQGFDLDSSAAGAEEHVGLRVMRERAEDVGGSLSLQSQVGQGTHVVVRVPLKNVEMKGFALG